MVCELCAEEYTFYAWRYRYCLQGNTRTILLVYIKGHL
nr:MAG TPA: hypothetical protein [Caudoviricetes sp.]